MLSLMLKDYSFADKCFRFVSSEFLHSETQQWLFDLMKKKFDRTGNVPSFIEIEDRLKLADKSKRRLYLNFAKKIYDTEPSDRDFLKEKLTEYARRMTFADLFAYGQTLYNAGKTDEAYTYVLEEINHLHSVNFNNEEMIDISDFETLRRRAVAEESVVMDRIPTTIEPLDSILMGGLSKSEGEVALFLSDPKRGKSIGLLHMAYAACTSRSGRVAYFILEGSTKKAINRYLARATNIPYSRIKTDELTEFERTKLERANKFYEDRLYLIPFNEHWDYSTLDVENKIKELDRKGKKPDLVVIDYADLLKPRSRYNDLRHDQREVYREIKSMALVNKIAVWTASQSQRPTTDPEKFMTLHANSISESYEKIRIVDFVATLNQTLREKDQGILRMHADIYRDNDCDVTVRLITDFSRMVFYSKRYGCAMPKELPKWALGGRL
jgi:replicative DNA helicase